MVGRGQQIGRPAGGVTLPTGWFAGSPTDPHDVGKGVVTEFMRSLTDDPGIRLAATVKGKQGGGTYTGTGLAPQLFLSVQGGANSPAALEAAPIAVNTRNAVNRGRGTYAFPGS